MLQGDDFEGTHGLLGGTIKRFDNMLGSNRHNRKLMCYLIAFVVLIFILAYFLMARVTRAWSDGTDWIPHIVSSSTLYLIHIWDDDHRGTKRLMHLSCEGSVTQFLLKWQMCARALKLNSQWGTLTWWTWVFQIMDGVMYLVSSFLVQNAANIASMNCSLFWWTWVSIG